MGEIGGRSGWEICMGEIDEKFCMGETGGRYVWEIHM